MIYLFTAIVLSPGGSSTVNIYTQTVHRTTQSTANLLECGPCPVFESFTLAFALQLRKNHGKTSVRLRKTSVRVQYTYYQNTQTLQNPHQHTRCKTHTQTHTHTLQNPHTHTYTDTHTHTHITQQYKTTTIQIKRNTVPYVPKCYQKRKFLQIPSRLAIQQPVRFASRTIRLLKLQPETVSLKWHSFTLMWGGTAGQTALGSCSLSQQLHQGRLIRYRNRDKVLKGTRDVLIGSGGARTLDWCSDTHTTTNCLHFLDRFSKNTQT